MYIHMYIYIYIYIYGPYEGITNGAYIEQHMFSYRLPSNSCTQSNYVSMYVSIIPIWFALT